jgi:2-dehydropantoate 2-reductase
MMREAQEVAHKLGIEFRVTLDKRIAGAEKVGAHKTSMLQDIEAGRAPEIDALVGSVAELGRLTQTPTPHIDSVYALVKLLAARWKPARAACACRPAREAASLVGWDGPAYRVEPAMTWSRKVPDAKKGHRTRLAQ